MEMGMRIGMGVDMEDIRMLDDVEAILQGDYRREVEQEKVQLRTDNY